MYNFFVLGLIPGTDIEITFAMWLEFVLLVFASVYALHYVRTRKRLLLAPVPSLSAEAEEHIMQLAQRGQLIRHIAATLVVYSADPPSFPFVPKVH